MAEMLSGPPSRLTNTSSTLPTQHDGLADADAGVGQHAEELAVLGVLARRAAISA
jgi:hypothetical protein